MKKSIIEILREGDEQLIADLTESLESVIAAVQVTGKAGSLSLTISIKPAGRNTENQVLVTNKVAVKVPEPDRQDSFFYVDDDNTLCRDNPRQGNLPGFTVVEKEEQEAEEGTKAL